MSLCGKRILLGVTGGIAAAKSAELVRGLREHGAEVRVVLTPAARRFVGEDALRALSGNAVVSDWFDDADDGMEHIHMARWADVMVVAPLSANTLAKMAHGQADNVLTGLYLATTTRVALAPAMNCEMWVHPATQDNINVLRERGAAILGPDEGMLACGETGTGRMSEPADIVAHVRGLFETGGRAARLRALITAGPTVEALDPVRHISNHSSGKMGFALARAAVARGVATTVVAGPVSLATPGGVERADVVSAQEMHDEVMSRVADADIFIACAAVSDYRCAAPAVEKIKKDAPTLNVTLERTPDILAAVSATGGAARPFCVGFAAETGDLEANAKAKMLAKNLDMVVANHVHDGFGGDTNRVEVYCRTGRTGRAGSVKLGPATKTALAAEMMDLVLEHCERRAARSKSA